MFTHTISVVLAILMQVDELGSKEAGVKTYILIETAKPRPNDLRTILRQERRSIGSIFLQIAFQEYWRRMK
jgi:hypothetical protein